MTGRDYSIFVKVSTLPLQYKLHRAYLATAAKNTRTRNKLAGDGWRRGHLAPLPGRGRPGSISEAHTIDFAAVSKCS